MVIGVGVVWVVLLRVVSSSRDKGSVLGIVGGIVEENLVSVVVVKVC